MKNQQQEQLTEQVGEVTRAALATLLDRRLRFVLSEELSDGVHDCVVTDHATILAAVKDWLENATEGDHITIRTILMTDAEVEALPEI